MATEPADPTPADIEGLARAAEQMGVEFDTATAHQWLMAVSSADDQQGWVQDCRSGVFGSHVALADFNPDDLTYFRRLARQVRMEAGPGVETALAIAGSSAQGKVQLFPGDVDFFERINIRAASEAEARRTLRDLLRATALRASAAPDIVLVETNFGVYPWPARHGGQSHAAGNSILWKPEEVLAGEIVLTDAAGATRRLRWDELEAGVGWSYLGWIVADQATGRLALVGNMFDVTWEKPEGALVALDGALDAFFQEVYLDAEALPIFAKLARRVDPGARQAYAENMRGQVQHYIQVEPSYCKATKRLYNLLRVTGQLEAAAYLRELFDEPKAQLYQADGLLEAVRLGSAPEAGIDQALIVRQIERVRVAVEQAAEGTDEVELLESLGRLRAGVVTGATDGPGWERELGVAQQRCRDLVNGYFRERLFGMPLIDEYLAKL